MLFLTLARAMRVLEIVMTVQLFCASQFLLLALLDRLADWLGIDGDQDDLPESADDDHGVFHGAGPWDWMCMADASPPLPGRAARRAR